MSRGAGVVARSALRAAARDEWRPLPDGWGLSDVYAAAVELGLSDVFVREWFGAGRPGLLSIEGRSVGDDPLDVGGGLLVACTADDPAPWRWRLSTTAMYLCGPGMPGRVGGQVVNVVDLGADVEGLSGPLWGLTPAELLRALRTLETALGVPWASSVGQMVQRLIRSTHPPAKGGRLLDVAPAAPAPCESGGLEQPWASWRRPLGNVEQGSPWLHVFDANAQYLAAWQVTELGFGEPRHVTRPRFDPREVGVWRLDLSSLELPTGWVRDFLPAPWLPGREWVTTPTLTRALEVVHGADVPDIEEAWVWPEHARYLRGAGERLRDARATALAARQTAAARIATLPADPPASLVDEAVAREVMAGVVLDAVKSLYVVGTGRFNMPREGENRWARPDWGHEIRATARVNLHRRLCKLGAAPFAIATDALVFLADEADPAEFAKRIRLPIGAGLGEFRHDATILAADVGPVLLRDGTAPGIIERVGALLDEREAAGVTL